MNKYKKSTVAMMVIAALTAGSAFQAQAAQVTYQPYIQHFSSTS